MVTWCNLVTISCAGQNIRDRLSRSPAGRVTFVGIIETFLRFICRSVKPFARFWPTFAELSFFLPRYFFQLDKIEELCCSSRDRETKCLYRRFAFLSKETFDLSEFTYFTINWKIPSSNVFSLFLQVFVHFVSINIKYFQA